MNKAKRGGLLAIVFAFLPMLIWSLVVTINSFDSDKTLGSIFSVTGFILILISFLIFVIIIIKNSKNINE